MLIKDITFQNNFSLSAGEMKRMEKMLIGSGVTASEIYFEFPNPIDACDLENLQRDIDSIANDILARRETLNSITSALAVDSEKLDEMSTEELNSITDTLTAYKRLVEMGIVKQNVQN